MIDIDNYKRSIAWLRSSLNEHNHRSEEQMFQLGVLHCFEVTHNISEAILREAYVSLAVDEQALYLSIRELIRRAAEEGVRLSSPSQWLEYAIVLESTKQGWYETATVDLDAILSILPHYADDLDAFATSLQQRMATLA